MNLADFDFDSDANANAIDVRRYIGLNDCYYDFGVMRKYILVVN